MEIRMLQYTASKCVSYYAKTENRRDKKSLKLFPRTNLIQRKIQNPL
jgi:hypothetical protein